MGADGMFSPDVVSGAGDAVEGVFVSSPDFTQFGAAYILPNSCPLSAKNMVPAPLSNLPCHAYDAMIWFSPASKK